MKWIVASISFLFIAGSAHAVSITRQQVVCSTQASALPQDARSTTTINATTIGDLIISLVEADVDTSGSPYPAAPTDSAGNTYSSYGSFGGSAGFNPSAGNHGMSATYNYTVDTVGGVTQVYSPHLFPGSYCVLVYRSTNGWPSNPTDKSATAYNASGASWSSGNTAALSQASELAIGAVGNKNGGSAAVWTASGWSNLFTSLVVNSDFADQYGEQIVSATTALAYSGTSAPNDDPSATIMTFKDNPGAAAPGAMTFTPGDTKSMTFTPGDTKSMFTTR